SRARGVWSEGHRARAAPDGADQVEPQVPRDEARQARPRSRDRDGRAGVEEEKVTSPHIVGIGGTTRPGSSTEKAIRYALAVCRDHGATTTLFAGEELATLPHYAPESPERAPQALRLLEEIRRADGIIIGSPGYHGSVSGLVKNAVDYTEDLRDDTRCYLTGV